MFEGDDGVRWTGRSDDFGRVSRNVWRDRGVGGGQGEEETTSSPSVTPSAPLQPPVKAPPAEPPAGLDTRAPRPDAAEPDGEVSPSDSVDRTTPRTYEGNVIEGEREGGWESLTARPGERSYSEVEMGWRLARGRTRFICPGYDCRHRGAGDKVACVMCGIELASFRALKDHFRAAHHRQFRCGSCNAHFSGTEDVLKHCRSASHYAPDEYCVDPLYVGRTRDWTQSPDDVPHWTPGGGTTGIECQCGESGRRGAIGGGGIQHPSCGLAALAAARTGAAAGIVAGRDYHSFAMDEIRRLTGAAVRPLDAAAAFTWLATKQVKEEVVAFPDAGKVWFNQQTEVWTFSTHPAHRRSTRWSAAFAAARTGAKGGALEGPAIDLCSMFCSGVGNMAGLPMPVRGVLLDEGIYPLTPDMLRRAAQAAGVPIRIHSVGRCDRAVNGARDVHSTVVAGEGHFSALEHTSDDTPVINVHGIAHANTQLLARPTAMVESVRRQNASRGMEQDSFSTIHRNEALGLLQLNVVIRKMMQVCPFQHRERKFCAIGLSPIHFRWRSPFDGLPPPGNPVWWLSSNLYALDDWYCIGNKIVVIDVLEPETELLSTPYELRLSQYLDPTAKSERRAICLEQCIGDAKICNWDFQVAMPNLDILQQALQDFPNRQKLPKLKLKEILPQDLTVPFDDLQEREIQEHDHFQIFTDGSYMPQAVRSASWAFVVLVSSGVEWCVHCDYGTVACDPHDPGWIGHQTPNARAAEVTAIVRALEWCFAVPVQSTFQVRFDAENVGWAAAGQYALQERPNVLGESPGSMCERTKGHLAMKLQIPWPSLLFSKSCPTLIV